MVDNELKIGDKAPLFKLESYNEGSVDLAQIIGSQKIVLIFSRYFGCPLCHLDLNILLENLPEIKKKGAKVLYVTQSGEKVAKEFIKQKKIDFPVIPSSKDELYKEYGLGIMTSDAVKEIRTKIKEAVKMGIEHGEYEGYEKQGPGQFVIDTDGTIIHAKKGWLSVDSLLEVL
ncbi:MAG: peroxiredoxin-like family protein [Promethearchaeota archaeon]